MFRRRQQNRAHADLVGALISYLRVENETEAARVRGELPEPADAAAAVSAARTAYKQVAAAYAEPFTTRAPLNLGAYLAEHSPADARAVLEQVVTAGRQEHAAEANAWLGVVLAGLGDRDAAIAAHRAAIAAGHPFQSVRAMINLGELHHAAGDFAEARELFEQAIAAGHPTLSPRATVDLAGVFLAEGDLDAAQEIYEEALTSSDPEIVHVATQNLRYLAADYEELAGDSTQRAWHVFDQLVKTPCWYQTRAILHRHEALLPHMEAVLREAAEGMPASVRDDLLAFVDLVATAHTAGVDEAVAAKSGIPGAVPAELRLLLLQAAEASDRFVGEGGQASLDDAHAACVALLGYASWDELAPADRLAGLGTLRDVLANLFEETGTAGYLDMMTTAVESMAAAATAAGESPEGYLRELAQLRELQGRARAVAAVFDFVAAVPDGEAATVLAGHPELLDDEVLAVLGEYADRADGDVSTFVTGVALLRLCREEGVEVALATTGPGAELRMELLTGMEGTADEIRDLLDDNPLLLDRGTELLLSQLIVAAEAAGQDPAPLAGIQELLRRCREIGVAAAVDEVAAPLREELAAGRERSVAAMDELLDCLWEGGDTEEVVARHGAALLNDRTDGALTAMIAEREADGDDRGASFLRYLRHDLRRYRVFGFGDGATTALAELVALPGTPEETFRRLLAEYPALLLPVADDLLADVLDQEPPEEMSRRVAERRVMLRDCRELDVGQAVANAWWHGALLPDDLRTLMARGSEVNLRLLDGAPAGELDLSVWDEVAAHPALTGRPWPAVVTEMYGAFHLFRHRIHRVEGAIELAVAAFEDNVTRSPEEPELARRLQFLADALGDRYELRGHPDDLRRANEALARQAAMADVDGAATKDRDTVRAKLLLRSYDRFGSAADLDEAIVLLDTPTVHEDDVATMNLAAMFNRRFRRDGDLADLERAIELDDHLLARPVTRPDLAAAIRANAGMHLVERFEVSAEQADLERGVSLLTQAVRAAEAGSVNRARYLGVLGSALAQVAGLTGRRVDADAAIEVLQAAVAATDVHSFEYANRLNNLGAGYIGRYVITGRRKHLDEGIATYEAALAATAADAPSHAWRTTNLAQALEMRAEHRRDPRDLQRAATLLRDSTTRNLDVNVVVALRTAISWGDRVAARSDWPQAAGAYLLGLEASERLFRTQGVRGHKETWLRETGHLFPNAAYALLRTGDAVAAVQAFELGRARLLSEVVERERAAIDRLADMGHQSLHDRFLTAAARVRELETNLQQTDGPADGSQ